MGNGSARTNQPGQSGFTLIEIVIIIVILGLLVAVGTPAFRDLHNDAKQNTLRASLGSMREAIHSWHAASSLRQPVASWPELDSLATPGIVLAGPIPENPFQAPDHAPDSVVEGLVRGVTVGDRGGWAYKPSTGEIWPNTSTILSGDGCAGEQDLNESSW